jgi:ferredoxin
VAVKLALLSENAAVLFNFCSLAPYNDEENGAAMTFVVTEACIRCKYMECTTVCPVDCFYEGINMLVINQSECIDCGSCEPICPSEAIISGIDDPDGQWAALNQKYAVLWPRLKASQRGPAPTDADEWKGKPDKLANQFDPSPAQR